MSEADQLVSRQHANPHGYLGAHPDERLGGDPHVPAGGGQGRGRGAGRHARGARARAPGRRLRGARQGRQAADDATSSRSTTASPGTITIEDPYRFLPTIGELDVHLLGEGRHEELWERLGAHVREVDGVAGTAFAVWAPSARAVSVVGDFNYWDGRIHPMRTLGSSGIWELFLPGVGAGARYKYEILAPDGEIRLKADPVAFETEVPPKTASVVHDPQHEWADDEWIAARSQVQRARGADVDLRGPPRLVAAEPARGQPLADATWSWPTSCRPTSRTWASPTSSCCR